MNIIQRIGRFIIPPPRINPEIERLRTALKVAQQALMEVQHAQEQGPGWYTKGVNGMYQQTTTWVRKGLTATREALSESQVRTT